MNKAFWPAVAATIWLLGGAAFSVQAKDPDQTRLAYQAYGFASESEYLEAQGLTAFAEESPSRASSVKLMSHQAEGLATASDAGAIGCSTTGGCDSCSDSWLGGGSSGACGTSSACGMADACGLGGACGSCDPCGGCCGMPFGMHRNFGFGDFLYLRARNADVAYAAPIDGPIQGGNNTAIQIGRIALVDPDYSPGFRVGYNRALSSCSSVRATYTNFASNTNHQTQINAPDVLRSLVFHPNGANAASDFVRANANYGVDFQLADADYLRTLWGGCNQHVNLILGARYGYLNQDFQANFLANGTTRVLTDLEFDGVGPKIGLDFGGRVGQHGFLFYGNTAASFMAGEFRTLYQERSSFDALVAEASWKGGRILTTLDLELGGGWQSKNDRWRFTAGYLVSAWFNAVKTDDYIAAVQANDFRNLSNTLTFDGLVARAEVLW